MYIYSTSYITIITPPSNLLSGMGHSVMSDSQSKLTRLSDGRYLEGGGGKMKEISMKNIGVNVFITNKIICNSKTKKEMENWSSIIPITVSITSHLPQPRQNRPVLAAAAP